MAEKIVSKDNWIANVVKGRTFADVGGLWGTVNEKVSVAMLAGAQTATMIDITPLGAILWTDFDAHCAQKGVSGYRCVQADATRDSLKDVVGTHDVVHCSGIIYHVPDVVGFVRNLRAIARRHLIITSMVFPPRVENEFGVLDLSGGNALFVPLLTPEQRRIAGRRADDMKLSVSHLNGAPVEKWFNEGHWAFGPWSWLMTPQFLAGLARVCELTVVDEGYSWADKAYSILCEV